MSGVDIAGLVAFLNEAAVYFERRDTNGEDSAFWSNVANAENCRKAAARLAQVDALDQQCQGFANLNAKLKADNKEMGYSFDVRWGASRRATERWQAANPGNDLTWPDHADLVVWCLDEVSALTRQRDEALAALKASEERGGRLSQELASASYPHEPWQDIATAPKDGASILLFCPQGDGNPGSEFRVTVGSWSVEEGGTTEHRDLDGRWIGQDDRDYWEGWISWDGGFSEDTMMPTHWTPMPKPPKGCEVAREDIAKIVYAAMKWAAERAEKGKPPEWIDRGNSLAQTEARRFAGNIVSLTGPDPADRLADKIEDLMAEFGADSLPIIGGYLSERRHARSAGAKALENSKAPLADATNNPPSDPGTEQREAGV